MAEGSDRKSSDVPEQHPYVERLRPDPSKPPRPVVTLTGLLGRSDRSGYQRLYFTRDLGTYAEFTSAEVLFVEPVPAADSPIKGIDASRVTLSHEATVHYTWSTRASTLGDFDLDVRTARAGAAADPPPAAPTWDGACPGRTIIDGCEVTRQVTLCRGRTCIDACTENTCRTDCAQATCETCHTQCGTCQTCPGQDTCQTCPGQNTCQTCHTQCDTCGPTCHTCQTDCAGRTCVTCEFTCNPHVHTCAPPCIPE